MLDSYITFLLGTFFTIVSLMLLFFYVGWKKARRDIPSSINNIIKLSAAVFLFLGAIAYVVFSGEEASYDSIVATTVSIFYICFLNFLHYVSRLMSL